MRINERRSGVRAEFAGSGGVRPHPFREARSMRVRESSSTPLTGDKRDRDFSERRPGLTGIENM
jgi:hypothetical protein